MDVGIHMLDIKEDVLQVAPCLHKDILVAAAAGLHGRAHVARPCLAQKRQGKFCLHKGLAAGQGHAAA